MRRLLALLVCVAVLAPSGQAAAQSAFDESPVAPAPPRAPAATPTPAAGGASDDIGRTTLFALGGALLAGFGAIAWWITRDARRSLPQTAPPHGRPREEGPHRKGRAAKAAARRKARAARAARRRNR